MSQDLLLAALRYAAAGYHVIPLRPRGKLPLTQHGAHDGTTDEAAIRSWWAQWPNANIGITLKGLVVVDIDPRNGGDPDALPFALPDTCFAKTGGGGWHYLYIANGIAYEAHPAPGIDVKTGYGAYIVAEPSIHESGERYCWLDESEPWTMKPTEAPGWLAKKAQPASIDRPRPGATVKFLEGGRNNALASLAGAMRRRDMSQDGILAALQVENEKRCFPPLDDADVRKIASSVARYEPAQPAGQPPKQRSPQTQPNPETGELEAPAFVRTPLNWSDLSGKEPPARRWAIKGWLGFGHTSLLVGSGGIGKTLLTQQAASCLALGMDFIDEVPEPQRVLMWACEDDHDELWRRQLAIAQWLRVGLESFADNLIIEPRHGRANTLIETVFGVPTFTGLLDELKEQANDYRAQVVILDNVGQIYGAGENDRHAVTMFLNALAGALPGRALLLLAHPSRGQGSEFSGSSAWENVARTRLYLGDKMPDAPKAGDDEEPDPNERILARRKANYSSKDWRKFNYENGVLVPDAVAQEGSGIVGHIRSAKADKVVVSALRKLSQKGIRATESTASPQYLPKLILQYKLDEGLTKRELQDAMRKAILDNVLERSVVGKNTNRTPMFGLKVAGEKES